jgi:hypothetical protein
MVKDNSQGTDELWGLGVPIYHLIVSNGIILAIIFGLIIK